MDEPKQDKSKKFTKTIKRKSRKNVTVPTKTGRIVILIIIYAILLIFFQYCSCAREFFYYPYRKSRFRKYNNARVTLFAPRRFRRESFN